MGPSFRNTIRFNPTNNTSATETHHRGTRFYFAGTSPESTMVALRCSECHRRVTLNEETDPQYPLRGSLFMCRVSSFSTGGRRTCRVNDHAKTKNVALPHISSLQMNMDFYMFRNAYTFPHVSPYVIYLIWILICSRCADGVFSPDSIAMCPGIRVDTIITTGGGRNQW